MLVTRLLRAERGERPGKPQRRVRQQESVEMAVGSGSHTYLMRGTALALGRFHADSIAPCFNPSKYNPVPEKALPQNLHSFQLGLCAGQDFAII